MPALGGDTWYQSGVHGAAGVARFASTLAWAYWTTPEKRDGADVADRRVGRAAASRVPGAAGLGRAPFGTVSTTTGAEAVSGGS